jgi:hypothetical protein
MEVYDPRRVVTTASPERREAMNESLQRLRDAVVDRGREVEVTPDGTVREVEKGQSDEQKPGPAKATKLAPRTFGAK